MTRSFVALLIRMTVMGARARLFGDWHLDGKNKMAAPQKQGGLIYTLYAIYFATRGRVLSEPSL